MQPKYIKLDVVASAKGRACASKHAPVVLICQSMLKKKFGAIIKFPKN